MNENDLVKHIENCESCRVLEDLRDKLNDYVKLRIKDVFACIDVAQIECFNNQNE